MSFGRYLKLGSKGSDVSGVKRALINAGYKNIKQSNTFGEYAVAALSKFQKDYILDSDGVYGPATHAKLLPFFDAEAKRLYLGYHSKVLLLPEIFKVTHQTDGLLGYGAIDVFAPGGTLVGAPCAGEIHKLSGHYPTPLTDPGGPYGWSQYLRNVRGDDFFLTHFGTRNTYVGQIVKKGQVIGTVADYTHATDGVTLSHIHMGKHLV
jgi:hypothetical protein